MKGRLNKSTNCFKISFSRKNTTFGSEDLLELREDVMLDISSLSLDFRNSVLPLSFETQSEKRLFEYLYFFSQFHLQRQSNIKGISNPQGIAHSITIIKGEGSWYTGCYSFQRYKGFDLFPCVLDIISTTFQIFITISLFTFPRNDGE